MGAVYGVAGSGWVYVGRHADVPTWNALSFIIPSLLILVLRPKSIYKMKPMLSGKVLGRMVLLGLVFGLSALTSLFAYSRGNVNLVATLQQTSIILTTVMAAFFLKETDRMWRKTAAALVCTIAVIMIV